MKEEKKLYTLLVYSENIAGILNQITAVFTRRQVNIESLNVSASSIAGVHKYTYYTDEELFIRETGLYKLSTQVVMENPEISRTIRKKEATITEVNPIYVIVMKHGLTEDIQNLYYALNAFGCVLQYTRSGRIAVTRSMQEEVSKFLEDREANR